MALQLVLLAAIALSALFALDWPDGLGVPALVVGSVLMALGALLVVVGSVQLGSALTPMPRPRAGGELAGSGLYRLARHPIYGGGVLVALGWSLLFPTAVGLVLTAVLTGFFELKSRREEAWLVEHYPGYADYRERTRRKFVPWLY